MPSTFDNAFARVKELAADFKANEKFYLSPAYQEAEARRDFIDKFLIALGWDVNHDTQKNPYEQEVKVERKEHGVSQRRADYAFYLAPNFRDVKFYIEAKKPFGDIATPDNYFQTVRYGWNSKTPIAALFDFEQFEIVDCRFKPDLETALQRNLDKFHFSDYSNKEKFAKIYWLFSREAVAGGSLEKYAEVLPKKRGAVQRGLFKGGYQSIDDAFLEELDAHRDTLAHIFKNNNPQLDGETLTEVTQRTLDRLVFIRFLEDKLIEPQYLVSKFGERGSAWGDFIATSRRLDGIYNGIVFKKNEILDGDKFKVDDDQFSGICEALCHINSPYDFNAIPIHILGSIYERFLGKVIVATAKRATVEEKPEVRKAGGVYYTPEYIVRYIVENTVGKLIEGKSPAQIAEMRFADIACGSGSFLLGVYDLLLRYHTKFYNENPGKAKKGETVQRDDGLHLSLQKKREILLNNIYGVDIDTQAVEVAQLSLYLKLLADETPASARGYQMEFSETLLPTLTKNIVCGNSLIGTDILSGELFAPVEERKLNPMDYEQRFPEIMRRGGFDVILGNPPYIFTREVIKDYEKEYYNREYKQTQFKINTYLLFVERGFHLLNKGGTLGFIIPNNWLTLETASEFRHFILTETFSIQIVNSHDRVFKNASVDTSVLLFNRTGRKDVTICELKSGSIKPVIVRETKAFLDVHNFAISYESNGANQNTSLCKKISSRGALLESLAEVRNGIQAYTVGEGTPIQTQQMKEKRVYHSNEKKDASWFKYVDGVDVARYQIGWSKQFVKYGNNLSRPRKKEFFYGERLLVRQIPAKPPYSILACYVNESLVNDNNSMIITNCKAGCSLKHLIGILNSRLISFWFINTFGKLQRKVFPQFKVKELRIFPIREIDFSKPAEKARHDKLVSLVEQMLAAKPQLAAAQSDKDKDFYENKCAALDRQIDALVYELYALTPEEIQIVEGGTK